jgi:hypothetical protein
MAGGDTPPRRHNLLRVPARDRKNDGEVGGPHLVGAVATLQIDPFNKLYELR